MHKLKLVFERKGVRKTWQIIQTQQVQKKLPYAS